MSSSKDAFEKLKERVLIHVARQLGPALDVVDVTNHDRLRVRQVLLDFEAAKDPATPAEIRAAMHAWIEAGCLVSGGIDRSGTLLQNVSEVGLTCRGLVEARRVEPGCGRPTKVLTLRTVRAKHMLHARIETDSEDRDRALNKSGTALAALYVLLTVEPTKEKPLVVAECEPYFERLAVHGVDRRSGPTTESGISPEAIRRALLLLQGLLPLRRGYFGEDERRDYYYLDGPMPEIRLVAGDRRHCGDWQSFRYVLWRIVHGESLGSIPDVERILDPTAGDKPTKSVTKRNRTKVSPAKASETAEETDGTAPSTSMGSTMAPRPRGKVKKHLPRISYLGNERLARLPAPKKEDTAED